jgi:Raf kinase inhibitor-like YbhB/YbcL family protein
MTLAYALGRSLRWLRAGDKRLLWNDPRLQAADVLEVDSPVLQHNGVLPLAYAGPGVGGNISPPLRWKGVPPGTRELAVAMEDPDAPVPRPFLQFLLLSIPSSCASIDEGGLTGGHGTAGRLGTNGFGKPAYAGPRALPGHGVHRYVIQVFALNCAIDRSLAKRSEFVRAASGHVIGRGRLDVLFERPSH